MVNEFFKGLCNVQRVTNSEPRSISREEIAGFVQIKKEMGKEAPGNQPISYYDPRKDKWIKVR